MKDSAGRGECYPPSVIRPFIQNISFAQTCKLYSRPFLSFLNDATLRPGFLGQWFNNLWRQWFNNLQRAALLTSFLHQWFNNLQRTALLTSLVQYDRILGQQQLFMVNYACGFNQLEMGKYFEWIINAIIWNNHHIKIGGYSIYYKKRHDAGLTKIEYFFQGNRFLTFEEFFSKFQIKTNFFNNYDLWHAVPQKWTNILKGNFTEPLGKRSEKERISLDKLSCKISN